MLTTLFACTPATPERFLAFVRQSDGEYRIQPRGISALKDAYLMEGDLGTVQHGGRFRGDSPSSLWSGGVPLAVGFVVEDDTAIPLDEDGLLLFSFYAHLADVRSALEAANEPVSELFPVDMAWNPAVSPLFELSPADNAAYATGQHLFVLLPDGGDHEVPLLANAGVVAHEAGHMAFHAALVGNPENPPLVTDPYSEAGLWQAALHEGVADAFAALWLDDPRFLEPSLEIPARYLDEPGRYLSAMDPAQQAREAEEALLYFPDPYPLGTVFARVFWTLRVESNSVPDTTELLFRTMHSLAGIETLDGESFAAAMAAASVSVDGDCEWVVSVLFDAFGDTFAMPTCN